ncbi:MAG: DUF1010 domain-containing protein [Sterolibacterium sp.]|nr:DUF1010 domain-containing protein [Sterolibacterium sp.]
MLFQTAFSFSSVIQRLAGRFSGLRLHSLRQVAGFPFSVAPLRWRFAFPQFAPVAKLGFPVSAIGSNIALKPTRLRRSAYLVR